MTNARRFQLDEITIRPGTYFNPQTEIMIVVDDSPEVDHEIFETDDFEGDEWVLISEDAPLDEPQARRAGRALPALAQRRRRAAAGR